MASALSARSQAYLSSGGSRAHGSYGAYAQQNPWGAQYQQAPVQEQAPAQQQQALVQQPRRKVGQTRQSQADREKGWDIGSFKQFQERQSPWQAMRSQPNAFQNLQASRSPWQNLQSSRSQFGSYAPYARQAQPENPFFREQPFEYEAAYRPMMAQGYGNAGVSGIWQGW